MMEVLAHTKCAKMCKILSKLVGTLMFTAVMVSPPPVYLQGRPCPEYQGEVLVRSPGAIWLELGKQIGQSPSRSQMPHCLGSRLLCSHEATGLPVIPMGW